ncbi:MULTISPECIES: hypothetical protein [Catenuloplanes]|uniref:Uncharacterized protein n=1 Tax=Catenuloplanes niger TaxID=587534 RepID=A0AAE4CTF5_9ACTN|nr:hypothetical protein [Catenuloplanes niger]MDR7323367.1 hypothetical protein [Catenuloplanes niger]
MARNPNPARITDEIWSLWERFDALEPSALLGGIYAAKPGYHNYRDALWSGDYSRAEVAADRQGPGDKAAALDLTMSAEAMRRYTTRLDVAARTRDERLYIGGVPIIREFIGTKDSRSVYCYVLTGGWPLGVGADAGPDPGRDTTHLWHLHISFIRRFVTSQDAMNRLYSVLAGESLATWRAHGSEEGDMAAAEDLWRLLFNGGYPPGVSATHNGGIDRAEIYKRFQAIQTGLTAVNASLTKIAALLAQQDDVDAEEVIAGFIAAFPLGRLAELLAAELAEGGLNPDELAQKITQALPHDQARAFLDALADAIGNRADPEGDAATSAAAAAHASAQAEG